ncbi:hypothetical protein SFUMM280S_01028 [Streptomyces fumanus]
MPRLPHPSPEELRRDPLPLRGRTAPATGASRRDGIGHAVARRLAAYGAGVYLHHHVPHDAAMPWGADRIDEVLASVREALGDPGATVAAEAPGDLADPEAPAALVATAAGALGGRLDILVANHALKRQRRHPRHRRRGHARRALGRRHPLGPAARPGVRPLARRAGAARAGRTRGSRLDLSGTPRYVPVTGSRAMRAST